MYKVNDRNTSARCEIYSKATIKTSKHLNSFFIFKCFHKERKKTVFQQSPDTIYSKISGKYQKEKWFNK